MSQSNLGRSSGRLMKCQKASYDGILVGFMLGDCSKHNNNPPPPCPHTPSDIETPRIFHDFITEDFISLGTICVEAYTQTSTK